MPNAVLAQSLEDELEGSLLGNARSQFPSAAFMPSSSHFFPPLPSFQVAFTIPSFNVSLDSLEVYLEMLHLLFFRLSMCLPLPALQMGSSFLPSPVTNPHGCLGAGDGAASGWRSSKLTFYKKGIPEGATLIAKLGLGTTNALHI